MNDFNVKDIKNAINKMKNWAPEGQPFYHYISPTDESVKFWEDYYGCEIDKYGETKIGDRVVIPCGFVPEGECYVAPKKYVRLTFEKSSLGKWICEHTDYGDWWKPKPWQEIFLERIKNGNPFMPIIKRR